MNGLDVRAVNATQAVDVFSYYVEYPSFDLVARRHGDRRALCNHFLSTGKTVGGVHGDSTNGVFTDVLLGF